MNKKPEKHMKECGNYVKEALIYALKKHEKRESRIKIAKKKI